MPLFVEVEHDRPGDDHPLNVSVDTGDGRGLRPRLTVENNLNQAIIDLNLRDAAVRYGSVDAGTSAEVSQNFYCPAGTYYQPIRVFSPGSSTTVVWRLNSNGSVVAARDYEVTDPSYGVILTSPDGSRWRLKVDDSGALSTEAVA